MTITLQLQIVLCMFQYVHTNFYTFRYNIHPSKMSSVQFDVTLKYFKIGGAAEIDKKNGGGGMYTKRPDNTPLG